jgi:hypothetical protein
VERGRKAGRKEILFYLFKVICDFDQSFLSWIFLHFRFFRLEYFQIKKGLYKENSIINSTLKPTKDLFQILNAKNSSNN